MLRSRDTLRWLSEVRGLDPGSISSVEQLELAETMATLSSSIYFGMGSFEVDPAALPSLRRCAQMLQRHRNLTLYIEAHCGLEAIYHLPAPGQARAYTEERAGAVRDALYIEADALYKEAAAMNAHRAELELDTDRVVIRSWGCSRPLAWAFSAGENPPCDTLAAWTSA
jgi:hypothetical protein